MAHHVRIIEKVTPDSLSVRKDDAWTRSVIDVYIAEPFFSIGRSGKEIFQSKSLVSGCVIPIVGIYVDLSYTLGRQTRHGAGGV